MIRPPLKAGGRTLRDLTADLDRFQADGFDAIEVFAPCAGGFGDDSVPWITEGRFTCAMDYALKLWWEDLDLVRDAILSGDPRPIEATLRGYRDRVVAAGGVTHINAADPDGLTIPQRLLAAATVATAGELFLEIGDTSSWDDAYRAGLRQLLDARRRYSALAAAGTRRVVPTSDDSRFYAFVREMTAETAVLVVLNFQQDAHTIEVDLGNGALRLRDILGERDAIIMTTGQCEVTLPAFGFRILAIATGA